MKKILVEDSHTGDIYEKTVITKDTFEEYILEFNKRIHGDFQRFFSTLDKENFQADTCVFEITLRLRLNPVYDLAQQEREYYEQIQGHLDKGETVYTNKQGAFATELFGDEIVETKDYISEDYTFTEGSEILVLENDYDLPETTTKRFEDTKISSITSTRSVMRTPEKLVEYLMHFKENTTNPKIHVETTAIDLEQLKSGLGLLYKLGFKSIDVLTSEDKLSSLEEIIKDYDQDMDITFVDGKVA
jgi:hypothetical protein